MSADPQMERSLRAVFTVTVETRKGAFYFDRDGFALHVASRIEGALEDRDDIRDVTVVEAEPAMPAAAPSASADRGRATVADVNAGPGWYEVIHPRNATTCIAYAHEDGSLYLPEGEDLTPDEFAFAAARGNAHRLVRADELEARP